MKKILILLSAFVLLAGCAEGNKSKQEDSNGDKPISHKVNYSSALYNTAMPYKSGKARGLIMDSMSRADSDELEMGLMELSQEHFKPEHYFFQEGQAIKEDELNDWLRRKSKNNELGLNPAVNISDDDGWETEIEKQKQKPRFLSYVLEQNYLDKNGKLQGVSLGISLHSVDYLSVMDSEGLIHTDEVKLSSKLVEKEGKEAANEILSRLRKKEGYRDVPVFLTLFKEEKKGSILPGSFIAQTFVKQGEGSIDEWDKVDRKFFLFPTKESEKYDTELTTQFKNFEDEIRDYFPDSNFQVFARGLYSENELQKLIVKIPMESFGEGELISFTQYVTNLLMTGRLPSYVPIYLTVSELEQPKSIIILEPEQSTPFVHIYNN